MIRLPSTWSADTALDGGAVGVGVCVGAGVGTAVGVGVGVDVGVGVAVGAGTAEATAGRRMTPYACQLGAPDVSVEVGATAPADEMTRVEVRSHELPPLALRAVYPAGTAIVSLLLFSLLITRCHAPSVRLAIVGHVTLATLPLFTSGVTSSGVVTLTPENASMIPVQLLFKEPLQV